MSRSEHAQHHAGDARSVRCAVITVSDTRTPDTDTSGRLIRMLLEEAGHTVDQYRVLRDEPALIVAALQTLPDPTAAVIVNGGTGLSRRDRTFETLARLFDKEITGFGELFRMLSFQEIGPAAMLSRATAGVIGRRVVFSMPGATRAVELAMKELVLPELGHIVGLIRTVTT